MVRLYLWNYKGLNNVGHISLELLDGTYISYWPRHKSLFKTSNRLKTYKEDVRAQKREADKVLELPCEMVPYEFLIKTWWDNFCKETNYHLLLNNCASVVQTALRQGGFIEKVRCRRRANSNAVAIFSIPSQVYKWAKHCKKRYCKKKQNFILLDKNFSLYASIKCIFDNYDYYAQKEKISECLKVLRISVSAGKKSV